MYLADTRSGSPTARRETSGMQAAGEKLSAALVILDRRQQRLVRPSMEDPGTAVAMEVTQRDRPALNIKY